MYRHQLNLVVHHLHKGDPMGNIDKMRKKHDIQGILDQIEHEEAAARQAEAPVQEETPWRVTKSSRGGSSKVHSKTRSAPYHKRK